ncbi:hypothetical protein [Silvimonas soli]|uniref:hypothetical protein n=1 Tax=Silvimonas soli TaxID=2980100 RepID=UPI0024B345F8|nr:hypothetical protein [Silvimonas soli]
MITIFAILLTVAGAAGTYLAAPNQSLLAQSAGWVGRRIGAVLLLAATVLWVWQLGVGAGVFAALVTAVLSWIALPALALLVPRKAAAGAR